MTVWNNRGHACTYGTLRLNPNKCVRQPKGMYPTSFFEIVKVDASAQLRIPQKVEYALRYSTQRDRLIQAKGFQGGYNDAYTNESPTRGC